MLIGEVAKATDVTVKTLHYYESRGLLHEPARTASGYRDYGADAIDRVAFIRNAQASGLTLRQISEILAVRDRGVSPCRHMAELVDERLAFVETRLLDLRRTQRELRDLRSRLHALDPARCDRATICAAVQRP